MHGAFDLQYIISTDPLPVFAPHGFASHHGCLVFLKPPWIVNVLSLHNSGGVQTSLLSPRISALESDGVFYSLPVAPDLRPLLPPLPGQFRAKIESSLDFSGSSEEEKKTTRDQTRRTCCGRTDLFLPLDLTSSQALRFSYPQPPTC